MRLEKGGICDICGKARGLKGAHISCAKKRQRLNKNKPHSNAKKYLDKTNVAYLGEKFS